MEETIKCESDFSISAVGDSGDSIGIAQINLPSHPEISKLQALEPEFSIEFMAKEFKAGHARLWSCWRMQHPRESS